MTRNHSHDTELAGLIDRLVDEGQPTGHAVLDDLARTVPQSSPEFKHALEGRLIAALEAKPQERKTIMQHVLRFPTTYTARPHIRPIRPAYTLIAAVLGIALFAAALFVIRTGPPESPSFMAAPPAGDEALPAAQASQTPSPSPDERATATPMHSSDPASMPVYEYVVQPGDDCVSIAYQFGHTSLDAIKQIAELNHLAPLCLLPPPGRTILVPLPEGVQVPDASLATAEAPASQNLGMTVEATGTPAAGLSADSAATSSNADQEPTATPIPAAPGTSAGAQDTLRPVLVAARSIEAGDRIEVEDLIITYWPGDVTPPNAVSGPAQVLGMAAREDIPQWQPILIEQVSFEE